MKKIFFACFAIALAQISIAQTKKEVVKFTPPRIVKDVPVVKNNKVVKTDQARLAGPVITKDKPVKKKVKFAPPVIVKDKE